MRKLFKSKTFILGLLIGFVLFISFNFYSLVLMFDELCFHCIKNFGFPFHWYESGTIVHYEKILWLGLIADLFVMILMSFGIGLLFHFFAMKIYKHSPLK